jgi:chemotaxis protein methyltransferase CheR
VIAPTDVDFARFQSLIEREAGIYLSEAKKALLAARLAPRLRELALPSFAAYLRRIADDPGERVAMLDRIATNETQFFREPHHFELIERVMAPRWIEDARVGRRSRKLHAWSAGCSTGEEPYSLAMALDGRLGADWEIAILATDLSQRALARARGAVYPTERIAAVPPGLRGRGLLRGVGGQAGNVKVSPEVRALVRFERRNLLDEAPSGASFDLIFCRNVLIYFRAEPRRHVITTLISRLAPGGLLFLGHAESLPPGTSLRTVMPTVYQRGW